MSDAAATPAANAPWQPRVNPWWIALAVMLATFMEVLDTSIASVALPHIAGNLGSTQEEATWVLTSYLVSNAIVLPASAWFARFFGRKRFLIGCIIIFTASSFMCGAALSLGMLVVARVIQGAGGGALQPLAQAILLESFPPAKRGVALSVYGVGVVCAPIIGPTLGGWLTDSYTWRWAFYINLPVGVLAVFLISLFVEDPPYIKTAKRGKIDAIGLGLLSLWLATLQITLDKGQQADWFGAVWIRWFVVISVVSLAAFVFWELHTPAPIVNLHILKDRNFAVGCVLFGTFGAVLYAMVTLQPLFLQSLMGYTALAAGLTVSPRGMGALVSFFMMGILLKKISARALAGVGFILLALACYQLARLNLDVSMRTIVAPNILNGFALGFIFVPMSAVMVGTLPNEQMGDATGIQNLVRNVGGSVGISFVSTMLERYAQAHQALMAKNLAPTNVEFQRRVGAVQQIFGGSHSPADALQRAHGFVYNLLLRQASYWAYVQLFYEIAWVCLFCFAGVFVLKKIKSSRPVAVH